MAPWFVGAQKTQLAMKSAALQQAPRTALVGTTVT